MNVKNLVLGIGIFIVFMFVLHNGIRAFYDAPQYEDFCDNNPFIEKPYYFSQNCSYSNELRLQEQECYNLEGYPIYRYDKNGCNISVEKCDFCNRDYENAKKDYNKTIFLISLIIGILVLIVGYAVLYVEPVGSSLMASGIGAVVYGTIVNWENLGNLGRFLLLLLALVILIWIALRLNKGKKKN